MIKELARKIYASYKKKREINKYVNPLKGKLSQLTNRQSLTKEQKREIRRFFKDLTGENVPLVWHEYFYTRTGVFAKEYIPSSLYKVSLLYRANKHGYRDAYADKNMADILLPEVKHPHTILKNMNGYFYIGDTAVTREVAERQCWNIKDVLIKPSLGTHGDGARKLLVENGMTNIDGRSIGQLFDYYKDNFCIQEFIQQHDRMRALNPSSVNTIRILTYRSGMEILVLYTVVRIGRKGKEIDNESAGGISAVINEDGKLGRFAYGAPGVDQVEYTDTGIRLEGYEIPSYKSVVDTVTKLHLRLPFFNLIGWDMAVGIDGEPILVEWNICTELSQSANGPAFGKYTERIIRELMQRPNNQNKNW